MKIWLLTVLVAVLCKQTLQNPAELLTVTLYSAPLCPFCHSFIKEQLYPAYKKIGSSLLMELEPTTMVEGKTVNNQTVFLCEETNFTRKDCYTNKILQCGLTISKDQDKHMEFLNCVMKEVINDEKAIAECGTYLGLTVKELLRCAEGAEGDKLFLEYYDRRVARNVTYVPWIEFNHQHDENEGHARVNFLKTACDLLSNKPKNCPKSEEFYFSEY